MKQILRRIRRLYIKNFIKLPKYYEISNIVGENKKILDFGCWKGDLSKILIKEKNAKIVGCDLIDSSKFKHANFKYIKVTKEKNFPFKEKFDYIIFADVLEHLVNPKEILEEAFNHTNNVIVSIPNLDFFLYRIFPELENPPAELTPHLNHWRLKTFNKILSKGMVISRIIYCSDFPEFQWTNYFPFKNKSFFNQTIIMEIKKI